MSASEGTRPPLSMPVAAFVSSFDRVAIGPLLVVISASLGAPLELCAVLASGYYLAYGIGQPVWGILSDLFGRLRIVRITLTGAAIAGFASAFAPGLGPLTALRIVTGAFFGAVIPATMTYVGDTIAPEHRQRGLSDLMAGIALGTALATAVAGLLATFVGWQVVFVLPPIAAILVLVAFRRLSEPERVPVPHLFAPLALGSRSGWGWFVYCLAFLEGAALLGPLTFLAPALQTDGMDAARAGLITAGFGAVVLVFTRVVRAVSGRIPIEVLMVAGGVALALGPALVAWRVDPVTVFGAAAFYGVAWAVLHTSLQTWATLVVPAARGTAVALFSAMLFFGSAVSTALASAPAQHGNWRAIFAAAVALALPVVVAAPIGHRRWARSVG